MSNTQVAKYNSYIYTNLSNDIKREYEKRVYF